MAALESIKAGAMEVTEEVLELIKKAQNSDDLQEVVELLATAVECLVVDIRTMKR